VPTALNRPGAREVRLSGGRPPRELDVAPVRAGAELLGFLVAAVPDEVLDEDGRRRALEHGSTVLALELSKERAAAEVERRLGGALTLTRSASAVLMAPEDAAGDLAAVERLAARAHEIVASILRPGTASVGIGNLAESVGELARSHLEARQALRLSRRTGMRAKVTS